MSKKEPEKFWNYYFDKVLFAVHQCESSPLKAISYLRETCDLDNNLKLQRAMKTTSYEKLHRALFYNPRIEAEDPMKIKKIFKDSYNDTTPEFEQRSLIGEVAPAKNHLTNESLGKKLNWI